MISARLSPRHFPIRSLPIDRLLFHFGWIGWLLVALFFMFDPLQSYSAFLAVFALCINAILIVKTPKLAVFILPLPLLLGPIFAIPLPSIGFVTAGDIFTILLIIRTFPMAFLRINWIYSPCFLLIALMLTLDAGFSSNAGASLVGVVKILQFVLMVHITLKLIDGRTGIKRLFSSWTLIASLCSIVMLFNFFCGRPPLIGWLNAVDNSSAVDFSRTDILFRSTFFYANFFIPVGLGVVYSAFALFLKLESDRKVRFLLACSIPINGIALIINNTRAMLVPVALLIALLLGQLLVRACSRFNWKVISLLLGAVVLLAVTIYLMGHLISESQFIALFERAGNADSMGMRWSVWSEVISKIFGDPLRLFVGWGPQSTARQGECLQLLLTGAQGNVEGAFDSTIIGFLVEYGIVVTIIVFSFIGIWLYNTWSYWKKSHDQLAIIFLAMSFSIIFAHLFQQFSFGPPSLLALQLFAFRPSDWRLV